MQNQHAVGFAISKVKITEFQCCELILVNTYCRHSFRKIRGDQVVLKVSGYTVAVNLAAQRWDVNQQNARDQLSICNIISVLCSCLSRGSGRF
jgi:hypothetical protein